MQEKLLTARQMIRENKYKQAVDFLTGLTSGDDDSGLQPTLSFFEEQAEFYTEAKRLLAEVYMCMEKKGTAKKICEQLLEKNPSDADTLQLLAKIAVSMGHTEKAGIYFNDAVNAAPLNAGIWIDYMHYAIKYTRGQVPGIFKRAMEQNIDMFRDDYILYLTGLYKNELFSNEDYLQYYDKFAEYFVADKNHDEEIYENLIMLVPHIMSKKENIPFLVKILPAMKNSRHRKDDDEETFDAIHTGLIIIKMKSDIRIHEVLADMTTFFLSEETDQDELLGMEYYIVSKLSDLRPSIKTLKNEYPDFFKLNQAFYLEALNEKKENYLMDKYIGKSRKLRNSSNNNLYYDDDFIEAEMPIIRTSPKVGRNDPCPCGSGKKYKKCCG
jgi:tetratricopeptide (TPR) repeat protein